MTTGLVVSESNIGQTNAWGGGENMKKEMYNPIGVIISRAEVEDQDIRPAMSVLRRFLESPQIARNYMENVIIAFDGYNNTGTELFEIPEVRNYVYKLDAQFPFWFYFLSKYYSGLQCIMLCFLPPYLTEEAQHEIFPARLGKLLEARWVPAMNQVCEFAGLAENEIEELTNRMGLYISNGPQQLPCE